MIDFAKITKTLTGLDCYYLGQRTSGDQVLHRFAVVNPACEKFAYYNEQGQRIEYLGPGVWVVQNDGHQIIAPPKIVEVTGWVALYTNENGGYCLGSSTHEPVSAIGYIAKQKHTFRFEVPSE